MSRDRGTYREGHAIKLINVNPVDVRSVRKTIPCQGRGGAINHFRNASVQVLRHG